MREQAIITALPEGAAAVSPIEPRSFDSFTFRVALTFATRLLMLIGVVGSSVIVARWLGPEGLGVLAVLNTTVLLALSIASLGLTSANTYFIAKDRKQVAPVWANTIVFSLIAGTLAGVIVMEVAKINPTLFGDASRDLLAIAALSIPFQLLTLLGLNILLAMDRIGQMNLLDSMSPALALVNAVLVLIILRSKLAMLVSFNTGAAIVLSSLMILTIARLLRRQKESGEFRANVGLFKGTMKYGLKYSIPLMAAIIIFRVDLLIVNHYRGEAEAGVYAVASQFGNLLTMLPGVIATLLFPRVASRQDQSGEFAVQVTRHTSLVMFILCIAAAAFSFALPRIYGARFSDATIQLLILLPGVFLIGIESVLVQHFTGTGLPAAIPVFWLIMLAVNLGSNLALVPTWGARAAAVNSAVSYALIFLFVAVYFCLKTKRRPAEVFLLQNHELREFLSKLPLPASASRLHE